MRKKYLKLFPISTSTVMTLSFCLFLPGVQAQAQAQECVSTACISVFIEDGQIIIEGRKDSPALVAQRKPRATGRPSSSPVASTSPHPVPSATRRVVIPKKTVVKVIKKVVKKNVKKVVAAVSLNDRLIKMLPTANISKEPASGAVVGVPVIFWCDLPGIFHSQVAIIGEVIDVTMRPVFFWSFGDGSIMMTTESGAPFPSEDISQRYSRAGNYPVVLVSIWGGTWSHNGIVRAITGKIRKVSYAFVKVAPAPTVVKR